MYANYQTAADLIPTWKAGLLNGERPQLHPVGAGGFAALRVGPGLLTLLGGPPGLGKTALVMQWAADALRASAELRAVVVNVETGPAVLLDRQLSRLSGIDYSLIRDRRAADLDRERLQFGFDALDAVADRLAFLNGPYTLEHAATAVDAFGAGLIVVDYLQRVPPTSTTNGELRQSVTASMQLLRQFTDAGRAVIVVSALARSKGRAGSTYDGAGLASFRESSEIEFGADDVFMLTADDADAGTMTLHHLKARHGEQCSLSLLFDGAHQSYTAFDPAERPPEGLSRDELAELWEVDAGGAE